MRKLILHTFLFICLILISYYLIMANADGYSDFFYIRFTTPPQNSLILGTSRAAQGIIPKILNKELSRNDIFNYSFTIEHSPYGSTYLSSIKRKLSPNAKDGIFVFSIDPWSISSHTTDPDDTLNFRETRLCLAKVQSVNSYPNIDYLTTSFEGHYFNILKNKTSFLHKDGWLEVSLDLKESSRIRKINKKIKFYRSKALPKNAFSMIRYKYLIKSIKYLKNYGTVYLVRLPVHKKILEIEDTYMPNFTNMIKEISVKQALDYYDMTSQSSKFTYTDGNHLEKSSGEKVSKLIANWILGRNNQRKK